MDVTKIISSWFGAKQDVPTLAPSAPISAKDSGPVPTGPLTITLQSTDEPRHLADLNIILEPGVAIDLGHYFTQKQILDSQDLKRYIDSGIVSVAKVGTIPSLEPFSLDGATISAEVTLDKDNDSVSIYGTDGVSNKQIRTDSAGIVQVNLNGISGAATESTLLNVLETLGGSPASPSTAFSVASLSYNVPGDVIVYTVPAGMKFRMRGARAWADVDAEFYVKKNGIQVDGYRTTASILTMEIDTEIAAVAGETITVGATHFKSGAAQDFKAAIFGVLETI
jgi:hypothetical protein